jgi:tetratricopeptide (TPR) repeat protein
VSCRLARLRFLLRATRSPRRIRARLASGLLAIALCVASAGTHAAPGAAPLLDGMGPYRGPIASGNALAQRHFGQGVVLAWGFNPAEAARSFAEAARIDPRCALCFWGLAWSLGPNVNSDMQASDAPRVAAAIARAKATARSAQARELVAALAARHPDPAHPDRLDEDTYAERMQALARAHPRNADLAMLAAEALINLHPYDWWDAQGKPHPWTVTTLALLDRAIALEPGHAGAHHYRIHVYESSREPARGQTSADRLRTLVPGSGHLLHMPAHIDMRTGRYDDAVKANERSIAADLRYLAELDAQGAYRVGYVAHNHHFLWAAAAMDGRSELARMAARDAWPAACGPGRSDRGTAILQHYYVLPLFALVRFGRWEEILTETLPPDVIEPYPLAMWHYARGTAYAKMGRLAQARVELAALEKIAAEPALERARIKNINAATALVRIAVLTLQADIASAAKDPGEAVRLLTNATTIEDALTYDEPHLWLAPTRHALGAALLAAGRPVEAERAYREDLAHYPENAWSLAGLARALAQQDRAGEAAGVRTRLAAASARADVRITSSRF